MIQLWKNKKIQNEILGINERNMNFVYRFNPKKHFSLADDKVKCKEILHENGIACAETYLVIRRTSEILSALAILRKYSSLAIKPANGSGGGGILILKKTDTDKWLSGNNVMSEAKIHAHLVRIIMGIFSMGNSDHVLVEQCIIPHPFFGEIYKGGGA